ncbi:hypothetical protein KM043_003812 [Ampulex compressa]|nr:hypothetical protein KM043_003812 [Ampulex compressa]
MDLLNRRHLRQTLWKGVAPFVQEQSPHDEFPPLASSISLLKPQNLRKLQGFQRLPPIHAVISNGRIALSSGAMRRFVGSSAPAFFALFIIAKGPTLEKATRRVALAW